MGFENIDTSSKALYGVASTLPCDEEAAILSTTDRMKRARMGYSPHQTKRFCTLDATNMDTHSDPVLGLPIAVACI